MKSFGAGFAAEGLWEENIQESVSSYYKNYYGKKDLDPNSNAVSEVLGQYMKGLKGFAKNMLPFVEGTKAGTDEDHQSSAIFLGGIMGGPSQVITDRLQRVAKMNQ